MKTQTTVGGFSRCARFGGRYQAGAGGAVVILALASGLALGFATVVERLTTADTASVSTVEASESLILPERSAVFYDEEDGTACDRAPCSRIRRWLPTTGPY